MGVPSENYQCPAANTCIRTGGPECGTVPEHLPALPLAEAICPSALLGALAAAEIAPEGEFGRDRAMRLASKPWLMAEFARASAGSPNTTQASARKALMAAIGEADSLLDDTSLDFEAYSKVAMLSIFGEAFTFQLDGKEKQVIDELPEIRKDFAELVKETKEAPIHHHTDAAEFTDPGHRPCLDKETTRDGLLAKQESHLMLLNAGEIAEPASTRESDHRLHPDTAHDFHIVKQGIKLPMRVRLGQKPNVPEVCNVSWNGCIGAARKQVGGFGLPPEVFAAHMSELIVAEGAGEHLISPSTLAVAAALEQFETMMTTFTTRRKKHQ